ncbi:coiled-coil domain-containing protein 177-like [Polyodon spathula]|uniref:coiled-coil domain-containing protein 177-like n=1 Tax=Polyodon spathula TaxID=7913 RepID=UPI001B7F5CC4|nr:coiled-coil domain-containing protein 177-like [Polyodon spathula]XP_041123076.1 coiled-coil domain-containing protein 177-like [Polyodon spathula]
MVDPPDAEEEGRSKEPGPDCSAATASAAAATGAPSPQIRNGPDPASEPSLPGRQREQSPKLHLDLFNFDSPEAEGSRYVLTSPRSLEACARCGVKPIVLLQRSVNDFAKEAPGESMQVAEGLFEVYERERQGKLRECREERERIIKEEKRRISNSVSSSLPCSPAGRPTGLGVSSISTKAAPAPATSAATTTRNGATPAVKTNGHAAQPKKKGKCRSLDSKPKKREPCHSTTTSTTMRTSSESGASSFSWDSPRDSRDKWPKASSPRVRTVASLNSLMGRSLSLGDLSHSPQTTKRVERIVKDVKRRGLSEVPERDRKIAALMLAKHQEEHIMSQSRYMAHLQWDSERRLEELSREREEREKQRAVLQCQRIWHTQVSSRQRQLSQEQKEMATIKQRQAEESEEKWRELAERQKQSRQDRLRQTAGEEKQKKSHQEHNLKALEEERRAILEQEQQLLQDKLTMAELRKQEREHQQQKELRGLNKAEKLRHKALIREIVRREAEERKLAKRTMEDKLSRSMENYEQIQERRNQELREKAKKEEQHIKKAQQAAEKKEKEQREHLESLARESERRAQQAAQVAEERAQQKALKAVQSRLEKEKIQRLNRQRVEEEEQQRRQELLMSIEKKLEKSEQIFREKRAVLESARSMARASFHVRDRVRDETNMRTFDKMALEAQLQASLIEK